MKRFVHTALYLGGVLSVVVGAGGFLLLHYLPPAAYAAWILPLICLLAGFFLLKRLQHVEHALWASVAAFVLVWGVSYVIWPRGDAPRVSRVTADSASLRRVAVTIPAEYRAGTFVEARHLNAPAGTVISVYRNGLSGVRWLAFSPRGELFASLPGAGEVVRLVDDNRDGYAEQLQLVAAHLDRPHGLAFSGDDLIVAGESTLYRLPAAAASAMPKVEVLSRDLPAGGGHFTRSVVVGPQGELYVAAGSSCNACEEKDARRATVRRFSADGRSAELFASGLRNTVGLAFEPQTGQLWGSDNGRDMLGDDLPPDEINLLQAGGDYGWPYCFGDRVPDPQLGSKERCAKTLPPQESLQAHSAPLGIVFGDRLAGPTALSNSLLVAYHGSWNRTRPTGYKLVSLPFREGRPVGTPVDLVSGWLSDGSAWGRPVALAIGADGALYVSDDRAGCIYRVQFQTSPKE